ncbi:MAG: BrnT family toxin [Acidobacteriota bacterium]|nr:BrnT family toxin [Acidobacteriota bacterium]
MKAHIEDCEGFAWDEGNSNKNWHLHEVTDGECEDVFFNLPLLIASDKKHSENEIRFFALGRTDADRWLFIAFTMRNKLIRVISARDMTKSEERIYAEKIKRDTTSK